MIQELLTKLQVKLEEFSNKGELAAFCPFADIIYTNPIQIALEPNRQYEIILHELIHWTGHKTRLNRPTVVAFAEGSRVSTQEESTEEVTAQLGMEKLAIALGLDPKLHAWLRLRYVSQWPLADLKKADREANEAVAWLLEKM